MHWRCYETIQAIRKIADAALITGDTEHADSLFGGVASTMGEMMLHRRGNRGGPASTRSMGEEYRILLMTIEVTLTIASKELREGNLRGFLDLCGSTAALGGKVLGLWVVHPIPPGLQAAFFHAITLETIWGQTCTRQARELVATMKDFDDPHLAHDAAILERCKDQAKAPTAADLPLEESAICKLPPRTYDFLDSSQISRKPERFSGFVDVAQLARLTDADKGHIHRLQEHFGVANTCFETYNSAYLEGEGIRHP